MIGEVQPSTLFAGTALKDGMVIHSINGIEYKLQRLGRALIEQLEKEPECQITIVASYVSVTVKKPAGGSLGIAIETYPDEKEIAVRKMQPNNLFIGTSLKAGMVVVLTINGQTYKDFNEGKICF